MSDYQRQAAHHDFKEARRKAAWQKMMATLKGQSIDLLPFDAIRQDLGGGEHSRVGLREIALDDIVGSVDRYEDYTRNFLPKVDDDAERWANLRAHIEYQGMEPISVFKLGEAYFVSDGHHRVSIARQMGFKTIQAYVTEVETRVPLSPEDSPEKIICKTRFTEFLERTDLDKERPDSDLWMTICGQYRVLIDQIEVVRYRMGLDPSRGEVSFKEAALRWYDTMYMPLLRLIREQGLHLHFPELSDTDLYLLVTRHRSELWEQLNWYVDFSTATSDLARRMGRRPAQVLDRVGGRVLDAITPDALESGPAAGQWRRERLAHRLGDTLFADILVAGRGIRGRYGAVAHAALLARRESGRLMGLHVVEREEERESPAVDTLREAFDSRCREHGLRGQFAVEVGPVARKIVERVAWVDLLVLSLVKKSERKKTTGFGTAFSKVLQRSPRPVLVVPEGASSPMDRILLAYDGSAKGDEALFAAAYFSSCWSAPLVVLSAGKDNAEEAWVRARKYLEARQVTAEYIIKNKPAHKAILETAGSYECNLIVMGGFGFRPFLQVFLGSTVNKVLEKTTQPVLICR